MKISHFFLSVILFLAVTTNVEGQNLKNILEKAKSGIGKTTGVPLTNQEVGNALKEALELGVGEAVKNLSATDGYNASIYRILLPEEAKKVTDKLKSIPGFNKVEAELILRINRAAELAAKEAGPIFLQAIKELSFQDAIGLLKGNEDAATRFLESKTDTALTAKFLPVIAKALDEVNARTYWKDAVSAYNKIPLIQKVNPELDKYVTEKSIDGMFSLVQVKEKKDSHRCVCQDLRSLEKSFWKSTNEVNMKEISSKLASLREDYTSHTLDESGTEDHPIRQFSIWFEETLLAMVPEPNAMVLATVQSSGRPTARVVLLKGLSNDGFEFFTNYESAKGSDMAENPFVSVVFNWLPLQRQVRIEGKIEKLSEASNDNYFSQRPYMSQLGAIASPQSKIVPNRKFLEEKFEELKEKYPEGSEVPRPIAWGGYVIVPDKIEFWQGRRSRLHDRIVYRKANNEWIKERLAP